MEKRRREGQNFQRKLSADDDDDDDGLCMEL
jgi:hypothetical protein